MARPRDSDWWLRLDAVFQGALEQGVAERLAYLDRACRDDLELRAEIDEMLAAHAPEHALGIERLVHDGPEVTADPDPFVGILLGPWRVIDVLGHGGMGSVYLAERADGRYEQRVALKLIRGSAQQPAAASRFKAETHILGRLSHPNIARLLDAGVTPEGSAYLVMDLVEGRPITEHCDAERLTLNQRLRLFVVVCAATQHAHQALIVHRDLKPSNIFVSRSGEVKLLDFGIAKLLERDHPLSVQTTNDMRVLTPAYAAPEQLRGDPVTTAADVYVLGAVLYELLTGQRPAAAAVAAGAVRDPETVRPPSHAVRQRFGDGAPDCAAAAVARQTTAARLSRRLEGDVDRVVLKALQPDPTRRYVSAGQLAEDIDRLLDGRPVTAQPDTLAYRLRRFIGRHRVATAMTLLISTLIIAFAIVAALQARALGIERDRARLEASRAERVSLLVADLFKLAEPGVTGAQGISARELLDRGAARIDTELAGDPGTQAALLTVVGRVYSNLSLHRSAIDVLQRAFAIERQENPAGSLAQAESLHHLGELHVRTNDYAAAEKFFREALVLRRTLGAPPADVAATLKALGRGLGFAGKFDEAEAVLRESVAILRTTPVASAELMSTLEELATAMHRRGEMRGAEPLYREAVEIGRRVQPRSPEMVSALLSLARLVHQLDRDPQRAEPLYREALALSRSIYSGDHQDTASVLGEMARGVRDLGKLDEAEALARESMTMLARLYGDRHRETMISSQTLASVLRQQGRTAEAEPLLREAVTTAGALFGDGHPMVLGAQRSLASLLEEMRQFTEAFDLRQAELASAIKARGERDVYVAIALDGLGRHAMATNQPAPAEEFYARALAVRRALHPPDDWRVFEARGMVGFARLRAGRFAEAETDLLAAHEGLSTRRGPTAVETVAVRRRLVELYERWNRPDMARPYRGDAR